MRTCVALCFLASAASVRLGSITHADIKRNPFDWFTNLFVDDEPKQQEQQNITGAVLKAVEHEKDLSEPDVGRPKYARVGTTKTEVLWQRPRGPISGILLWLHGCSGAATELFSQVGPDGWEMKDCKKSVSKQKRCTGGPAERLLVRKARERGYLVMGVTGGLGHRHCFHYDDLKHVNKAVKYVQDQENIPQDIPMIMAGNSAGGRFLGEMALSGYQNLKCIAPMSAEIPVGKSFPANTSVIFVHMTKDVKLSQDVAESAKNLRSLGVKVGQQLVFPHRVNEQYLQYDGAGLDPESSKKVMDVLKNNYLLKHDGTLRDGWREGGYWEEGVRKHKGLEAKIGGVGRVSKLHQILDISEANHASPAGQVQMVLDFCEGKKDPQNLQLQWKFKGQGGGTNII